MTTPQLPPLPDERIDQLMREAGFAKTRPSTAFRELARLAYQHGFYARPVSESIHAENAKTLQALVDELREMLGVKEGESLTASVRFLQEDLRSIATALARLARDYYGDPA